MMSETTTLTEFLGNQPTGATRKLLGSLGVASIVFMVVAAAAPLGVIGGVVPLGIASGNGAGFPATFVVATVILLFFAVGFTAMRPDVEEAGAFFSYVRKALGFPTSLFACILSLHNVVSRYLFALSQRDVLPASLSRPHDKHGSPHLASLWISGVVAISVIPAVVFKLDPAAHFYTWFAGATTVGIVILLIATSAVIGTRVTDNTVAAS